MALLFEQKSPTILSSMSRYRTFTIVVGLFSGCSVYDASLVSNSDSVISDKPTQADASPSSKDTSAASSYSPNADNDDDGSCQITSGDARCFANCIEVCNAIDDDCDGETDEEEAASSCKLDHAQSECHTGECVIVRCDPGFGDCDYRHDNGCETPTNTVEHCSECDQQCHLDHAVASCATQQCVVKQCEDGWMDCDSVDDNGCEHDENSGECPLLSVLYMPGEGDTKWLRLQLIIQNHSPADILISDVTLRYYYTVDSESTEQEFECWHPAAEEDCDAGFCCDEHIIVRGDTTIRADADYYVELSFTGDMVIPPAGQTDVISIGVHNSSWDLYDYTNDYSYHQVTEYTSTEFIMLYYQGVLVWGIEPQKTVEFLGVINSQ